MTELKPCPFYGAEAVICTSRSYPFESIVECTECFYSTGFSKSEGEAIKAWNGRVNDDQR